MAAVRGGRMAMIYQDPMSSLNPLHTVGRQIVEAIRVHEDGSSRREANDRAVELLGDVGMPQPERRCEQLPARVLGRHAPARDDRDGDLVPTRTC